jgi:hypothetical protein
MMHCLTFRGREVKALSPLLVVSPQFVVAFPLDRFRPGNADYEQSVPSIRFQTSAFPFLFPENNTIVWSLPLGTHISCQEFRPEQFSSLFT